MACIEKVYGELWDKSLKFFIKNNYELDPLITSSSDKRRGLTLLTRLDEESSLEIQSFINEAKRLEPDQYYYPKSDFHITVLSIITCYEGFQLSDIRQADYINKIYDCIENTRQFEIKISGITASPSCIMLQGYPQNQQLDSLRKELRERFGNSNLQSSVDSRYFIKTAHCTVMRFMSPMTDSTKFIEFLEQNKNRNFGTINVNRIELVFNDWYQKSALTKKLYDFNLIRN